MDFQKIINSIDGEKTFLSVNFGCRVNAAETNQLSQILIDNSFKPVKNNSPSIIIINTCSITKKGDIESLSRVRILQRDNPDSIIFVTGCANLKKLENLKNIYVFDNKEKEKILTNHKSSYTPKIKDKFSHTNRFLLKVQSGCNTFCSYCIVPQKRQELWSLPIEDAINTVNSAIKNNYKEIIITGVNLNLYKYGFSNLVEKILTETSISLISFGSIPLNCIDEKFIDLYQNQQFQNHLSNFLHIPLQSGSDKIIKLMHRPYTKEKIIQITEKLRSEIRDLKLGTDIIIGFPTESDQDFQETYDLCQSIGFSKIHVFKFSPRPNTKAWELYENNPKLSQQILKQRSSLLRKLNK